MLLGLISLYLMHEIVQRHFGRWPGWIFVLIVSGLSSAGIYVGRFLRWNSWDILQNPSELAMDILGLAIDPSLRLLAFTTLFAVFFLFVYLTLYTFSAENWKRPQAEVDALMRLLVTTIRGEVQELMANNVRLTIIGHLDKLPPVAQREMQHAIDLTAANAGLNLNLALSYGGRQEILEVVCGISRKIADGTIAPEDVNEIIFEDHLSTHGMPDPELIIRTSGEARLSNFLLWQSAYSELVISDAMWPEFRRRELYETVLEYQQRERRFGQVSEQVT